jgi:hypothetical protein
LIVLELVFLLDFLNANDTRPVRGRMELHLSKRFA